MQYALIDHKPVLAGDIAPGFVVADVGRTIARCIYCGEWVHLSTAPGLTAPAWFHKNDNAATVCSRERATAQAELYEAIGVEL